MAYSIRQEISEIHLATPDKSKANNKPLPLVLRGLQRLSRCIGRPAGADFVLSITLLADRELQVFELIGKGHSTRQIADSLTLDVKTIETYRGRIKEKLALKDSSELLQRAIAWVHHRAG